MNTDTLTILGLETTCDDTGVGIVDCRRTILANKIASQLDAHKPYGGVVPEIAARAHLDVLDALVEGALEEAGLDFSKLSGVAATTGPGLIGGVMVGSVMAKAIAAVRNIPFIAVNHLEAHALTARLTHGVDFPFLLLLASGGHCQLVRVKNVSDYQLLGRTIDDAVGECFDKCAKMLGLGYPGGPLIERAAKGGDPKAFDLPRPMIGRPGCDFSFSGLKTAVRIFVEATNLSPTFVADMAASVQKAIADSIADRSRHAFAMLAGDEHPVTAFVAAGGVASNAVLREALTSVALSFGVPFLAPPPALCTDNGVMVAWAGLERLRRGLSDPLDIAARPRWPLEDIIKA